jgi:biotin operon repressor
MRDNEPNIVVVDYLTGKPGFVNVYHDFLDAPGNFLCGEEKILWITLLRFFNQEKKYAYPSICKLENLLGWSNKTVIKYIKSLETKGLIKKDTNVFRSEQNNQYTLYDIEIAKKSEVGKKQFYYESLIGHIKDAEQNLKPVDFRYSSLLSLFEKLYKRDSIKINNVVIDMIVFFERMAQMNPEKLLEVQQRVIDRDLTGSIENRTNYLIKALYESMTTEAAF